MGNTASAAQSVATKIIGVEGEQPKIPESHKGYDIKQQAPPPECPMHQKVVQPPPAPVSECPIGGGGGDINPLNMVSK